MCVVTPFYNTREYLAQCIESVLRQTYQNWEYVLVDNCSTDDSGDLAASYASRFPDRIRLIHAETFRSQVENYNFALSCISPESKYCKIVQADDWIYPECIERMVVVAEQDSSIGIVSAYRLKAGRVLGEGLPPETIVLPGAELCRRQLTSPLFLFGSPTTLLYRASVLREDAPFYRENVVFDDTDACYRTLRTWNFGFVHQVLSFSRVDNDSIMMRVRDLGPEYLDKYLQLRKFGLACLSTEEFNDEWRNWKATYYRYLARRLLAGAGKRFWNYQLAGLKSGGLRLEKGRLLKYVLLEVLWLIANPGLACSRCYRRLQKLLGSRRQDREANGSAVRTAGSPQGVTEESGFHA